MNFIERNNNGLGLAKGSSMDTKDDDSDTDHHSKKHKTNHYNKDSKYIGFQLCICLY